MILKKTFLIFVFYSLISVGLNANSKDIEKAWLGISVKPTETGDIKLLITEVEQNSPADKSGLKNNDLLKSINGKNFKNSFDFIRKFNKLKPGQKIDIEIVRNNKIISKKIILKAKNIETVSNVDEDTFNKKNYTAGFIGIPSRNKFKNINFYKSSKLKKIIDDDKKEYLIVTCIYKGSGAEKKGIQLYDKIIKINNKSISSFGGVNAFNEKVIQVKILRNNKIINKEFSTIKISDLNNYSLNCIDEQKEFECKDKITISPDLREENYWEEVLDCLEEKNVNLVPVSGLSWDLKWIKVKAIEKLVLKYSKKKNRDIKKLNIYIPKALDAISELERFKSLNINTSNEANDYNDRLVSAISYSIKYAQVKGIKGLEEFNIGFSPTTVKEIRNNIRKISKKKDLNSKDIENILSAYDALNEPGDNEFIKNYWPKLIKKINWNEPFKYYNKYTPKEESIKLFQIFIDLGDLYLAENNFETAIKQYDFGRKKLTQWKKNNVINIYYVVYDRKFVVSIATPKVILAVSEYNTNLDNKKKADEAFNKLKSVNEDLIQVEKLFFSLDKDLQNKLKKRYPAHLTRAYQALITANNFLQDKNAAFNWAQKMMDEVKNYPTNRNNDNDLFEAHYNMILASLGVNQLNIANYHINQFKNYSLKLVESVDGVNSVANYSSFILPLTLHAGLYYETEQFINFTKNYLDFNYQIFGNFQRNSYLYAIGRISLKNKNYKKAIKAFEEASEDFLKNVTADIQFNYSALSSLLLLEAYMMNGDLEKFRNHFYELTNSYPENYETFSNTSVSNLFYVPSDIAMSQALSVFKYLNQKKVNIPKKYIEEIFSLLEEEYESYQPGEESKIEMIKYSTMITSELYKLNPEKSLNFLKFLKKEIKEEYSNAFFNSNLSPNHKIEDLIFSLLDIAKKSDSKKIFSDNYKLIQIASNSLTTRDLRKSFNRKKFKDRNQQKLIKEYQKLQIAKNSIYIADDYSLFKEDEIKQLNSKSFNNFERSKKIDNKLQELEKKIKSQIPEYFSKLKPKGVGLNSIQKNLSESQVFLEYFFFDQATYAIIIKKDNYELIKIDISKSKLLNLSEKIKSTLHLDTNGNLAKFDINSAHKLHELIFKPLKSHIGNSRNIILVPNNFLNYIPLQILPKNKSNNCFDCSKINWLKNDYNFTYIPNSEFFRFKENKKIKVPRLLNLKNKSYYLGIGNPNLEPIKNDLEVKNTNKITKMLRGNNFLKDTSEIDKLYGNVYGSEEELNEIKNILSPLKSDLLLGNEANEKNIKSKNLQDYEIIHFATHGELAGFLEGQNEPFLVLTPPEIGSDLNDGLLTLSEIMNLELNTKLIILSACNTASNNIKEAEGFTGLARAFLYSGSKSVMVSNWYVESNSAKELTTNFIKNLKQSKTNNFSEALSLSMKKLSSDKDTSHPFFWGPFVIVGLENNLNLN